MNKKLIISVTDYLITETVISSEASAAQLDSFLRKCQTTGKVTYDMSRGGHQRFLLVEKSKLNDGDSDKVRRLLGWIENNH